MVYMGVLLHLLCVQQSWTLSTVVGDELPAEGASRAQCKPGDVLGPVGRIKRRRATLPVIPCAEYLVNVDNNDTVCLILQLISSLNIK